MRRREFISLLGAATATWPHTAFGQQSTTPVVGYLYPGSPETSAHRVAAFRKGLGETGFSEGQNVTFEFRWADSDDRLREFAADLANHHVAAIAAPGSTPAALAAKAVTSTIPIVFGIGSDPIKEGLVTSFNRPGGNVTGITWLTGAIGSKQIGLLHELLPQAKRIAALINPNNPLFEVFKPDLRTAASKMDIQVEYLTASTSRDIEAAFLNLARSAADGLVVGPDALFNARRVQIVTLAGHQRLPAIYPSRDYVEIGGLASYGANLEDAIRQVGVYTGRILKGEKPADLPVLQTTKLEFLISLVTAKSLGLTIPPGVLAIADEVIE